MIGILGLLLVLIAGVALDTITSRMLSSVSTNRRAQVVTLSTEKLKLQLRDTSHFNAFWAMSQNPEFLVQRNQTRAEVLKNYHWLEEEERRSAEKELIFESERAAKMLFLEQDQTPVLRSRTLSFKIIRPLSRLVKQAIDPLNKFTDLKEAESARVDIKNRHLEKVSNWIARSAESMSVVLLIGIIWFLHTYLTVPMRTLMGSILKYKEGDREARAPAKHMRISEIGQAALAFNNLADRLNDLELRKQHYLAGVVHDIRNPLTALKTASAILLSLADQNTPPRSQRLLQVISEQIDRINSLVVDFIDTQQVESGHLKLRHEDVDLVATVRSVVGLWQIASKSHIVLFVPPEGPLMAWCDPNRIQQVLNNLLSNAIKYSPKGGPINVEMRSNNDFVSISVTDKGIGVPLEDKEKIFEPFQRSAATRDFIPGTGLGLSSTKRIIEAHGGRIEVDSRVGSGSTFRIHIPRNNRAKRIA